MRRVLTTPELLEQILEGMDTQDLLVNAQRVDKFWGRVIMNSPTLQRKLFFRLQVDRKTIKEPLVNHLLRKIYPEIFRLVLLTYGDPISGTVLSSPGSQIFCTRWGPCDYITAFLLISCNAECAESNLHTKGIGDRPGTHLPTTAIVKQPQPSWRHMFPTSIPSKVRVVENELGPSQEVKRIAHDFVGDSPTMGIISDFFKLRIQDMIRGDWEHTPLCLTLELTTPNA
jgi:hypothetical protein